MKNSLLINIKIQLFCHFHIYKQRKFHAQLSWSWKTFYNLRTSCCAELVYLTEFPPFYTWNATLWLPVCFTAQKAHSEKGSTCNEKKMLQVSNSSLYSWRLFREKAKQCPKIPNKELCHGRGTVIAYANSKVQASLCIRAVSPEPMLFAQVSGRRSCHMASIWGRESALKDCYDEMFEESLSRDVARKFMVKMTFSPATLHR